MAPSRRAYRQEGLPRRRSPLRLLVAFVFLAVLIDGLALGVLLIKPDLARFIPGDAGERLRSFGERGRGFVARLLSDEGPLSGVRRFAEPFLGRIGLNLETALLGVGLLFLAIVCIRILAVTSRPAAEEEEAVFRSVPGVVGEEAPRSPYWPYDRRPARSAAETPSLGPGSQRAATWPASARPGSQAVPPPLPSVTPSPQQEEPAFQIAATGDAWPVVRAPDSPQADRERQAQPGSSAPTQAELSPREPARIPVTSASEGVEASGTPLARPAGLDQPALASETVRVAEVTPIAPAIGGPRPSPVTAAAAVESVVEQDRGYPSGESAGIYPAAASEGVRPVGGEYLEDMPAPAYTRKRPAPPAQDVQSFPPRSATQPELKQIWVESRPGLGRGLRRFALPGLLLMALGAGGAYGLRIPAASSLTSSPYFSYMLAGAAGLVSTAAAVWFSVGPMRPVAKRITIDLSGEPEWSPQRPRAAGAGRFGAAEEAAAARAQPGPVRRELERGLEPPDSVDWRDVPKPSVFIPWSQAATTVALDIGSTWIKVAQVGLGRHGLEIVNLGLYPTPEGVVTEAGVSDPGALGEAIKALTTGRNIIQRQVIAALGGQGVIIRHVEFPQMGEDELREVIRWEAEHHIPIPPAEAVVDFAIMPGQAGPDERGTRQMRVMLVGAQRRIVEAYVDALKVAKLVPLGIDLEALAAYRVIQASGYVLQDSVRYAEAVVDLGYSSTKLAIYLKGALEMSRTLGVGGLAFTKVLAEGLQASEVEAEALKRQYGVRPEGGRVLQVLAPTLQDLLFEIRRSFEFFASRHFGQAVRHVYLVGGGARMPGIAQALSRYLNPSLDERVPEGADTKVEVVDPLSAAALTPRLAGHGNLVGPEFVTALGLALGEESSYES